MGTPMAHFHQGTDIMAPRGTPLVACERGVLTRIGTDVLGGNKLWIIGASGTTYYYAHLDSYAPGLTDGMVVEAGQLVGFVGNTGDAQGGATHLHFEVHPNGGPAVDGYPLLRAVADATAAATATATSPH
jgi:murein DD-endopeptidase MepM/ murein hydrolase activator NlpD